MAWRRPGHYLNRWWLVYRLIYVSFSSVFPFFPKQDIIYVMSSWLNGQAFLVLHRPLGNLGAILKMQFSILFYLLQCKPDISRSCISRNRIYRGRMLDPFFGAQERDIFREIAVTQFFAKFAHRDRLCSRSAGDNFSRNQLWPTCSPIQIWPSCCFFVPSCARNKKAARGSDLNRTSLPVNAGWNTCCVVVSHARRSIDTSIVSQSRVQLIQCQCKSRLQIANLDINNAFFNQIHAVYIRHFVQTSGQFRSESRARDW